MGQTSLAAWGFFWGSLSAVSLPIGSLIGLFGRTPSKFVNGCLMAFGGGALLEALSVELFGESVAEMELHGKGQVIAIIVGAVIGSLIFEFMNEQLNSGGAFFRGLNDKVRGLTKSRFLFVYRAIRQLEESEMFSKVPRSEIEKLVEMMKSETYDKGDIIFHDIDSLTPIYFVNSGKVLVEFSDGTTYEYGRHTVFGGLDGRRGEVLRATAECLKKTSLLILQHTDIDRLLESRPYLRRTGAGGDEDSDSSDDDSDLEMDSPEARETASAKVGNMIRNAAGFFQHHKRSSSADVSANSSSSEPQPAAALASSGSASPVFISNQNHDLSRPITPVDPNSIELQQFPSVINSSADSAVAIPSSSSSSAATPPPSYPSVPLQSEPIVYSEATPGVLHIDEDVLTQPLTASDDSVLSSSSGSPSIRNSEAGALDAVRKSASKLMKHRRENGESSTGSSSHNSSREHSNQSSGGPTPSSSGPNSSNCSSDEAERVKVSRPMSEEQQDVITRRKHLPKNRRRVGDKAALLGSPAPLSSIVIDNSNPYPMLVPHIPVVETPSALDSSSKTPTLAEFRHAGSGNQLVSRNRSMSVISPHPSSLNLSLTPSSASHHNDDKIMLAKLAAANSLGKSSSYANIPESSSAGSMRSVAQAAVVKQQVHSGVESVQRSQNAALAIWLGILIDGIPESLVIGILSISPKGMSFAFIVAIFLANLPEALSASVSMRSSGMQRMHIFLLWLSITLITGIGGAIGAVGFDANPSHKQEIWIKGIEGLAAGAMLTMIARAMLPEAHHEAGGAVGFSCLLGFLCSLCTKLF